jgi:hypothetical protein
MIPPAKENVCAMLNFVFMSLSEDESSYFQVGIFVIADDVRCDV